MSDYKVYLKPKGDVLKYHGTPRCGELDEAIDRADRVMENYNPTPEAVYVFKGLIPVYTRTADSEVHRYLEGR